jgi:hypothetical protein
MRHRLVGMVVEKVAEHHAVPSSHGTGRSVERSGFMT